jgi:hypothetical protein
VPCAQQPAHHNSENEKTKYLSWASKVTTGVTKILTGRRGNVIPTAAKIDLFACLILLDCKDTLHFSWDISLYTDPPALKAPRLPSQKVGSLPGDKAYDEPGDDYDEEDFDSIARPEWNMGEVHVVKLLSAPYWCMARFVDFMLFTLHCL